MKNENRENFFTFLEMFWKMMSLKNVSVFSPTFWNPKQLKKLSADIDNHQIGGYKQSKGGFTDESLTSRHVKILG